MGTRSIFPVSLFIILPILIFFPIIFSTPFQKNFGGLKNRKWTQQDDCQKQTPAFSVQNLSRKIEVTKARAGANELLNSML
jgi:hypothetical protein